jgi:hydroxymethylglutaryl-CoA lyase
VSTKTFNNHSLNGGFGLANAYAGLQAGVTRFDAALGGLGGCPFAPGATGNIATEDLVHMLHEMGIETGIDLDGLLAAARSLPKLVGHGLDSFVLKGGKVSDLHQLNPATSARSAER